MTTLAVVALLLLAASCPVDSVRTSGLAAAKSGTLMPGLAGAARFASLQAGGAYPTGDADVTMREGLGENLPFPGSDYLGMGYNALYGNPDGDGEKMEDPGWRAPVLRIPWCQDAQCLSSDMMSLRPTDGNKNPIGWAHREVACEMSTKVNIMKQLSEYSKSLEVDADVQVEGGLFGTSAAFSASAGYSDFKQEVAEGSSTQYQIKSYCTQYTIGIPEKSHTNIRDRIFLDALAELRDPKNDAHLPTWYNFFDTFGTHVAINLDLGGKMVMTTTAEDKAGSSSHSTSVAAAVSASFDGAFYGGSASLSSKASSAAESSFRNTNKKSHVSVFGGLPPASSPVGSTQGFGEWAGTVAERPMPVKYKLCRLDFCAGLRQDLYQLAVKKYAEARALRSSAGVQPAIVSFPTPLPSPKGSRGDRLYCNQRLDPGEYLFSQDGKYRAGFDVTFNFLVWEKVDARWKAKWQTRTGNVSGEGNDKMTWNCKKHSENIYAILGNQCTFHIMKGTHRFWSGYNGKKHEVCKKGETGSLILANDGHLYLVDHKGEGKWSSENSMEESKAAGKYWDYENAIKDKKLGNNYKSSNCPKNTGTDWRWIRESAEKC